MTPDRDLHRQRDRANSFGAVAQAYDRNRPRYPQTMIDDLVPGVARALDVGAGTGISSAQLAHAGVEVLALEPDPQMAAVARDKGVRTECATFEDWAPQNPNAVFDLVLFAQSFHWVDPTVALPRVRTLLSPQGVLALAWNRLTPAQPTPQQLAQVYRDFLPADSPLVTGHPTGGTGSGLEPARLEQLLTDHGFTSARRTYPRTEHFARDRWLDLVFTYSNHLVLEPAAAAELRTRLAAAIGPDGVEVGGDTLLVTARPTGR